MGLIQPSGRWRHVSSPRGAIADFIFVFRNAGPNRWRIAVVSAMATAGLFSVMAMEGAQGPPARPTVTYITAWPAHRTDAEIIASNEANQRRKERLAAEQAKREEAVRDIYRSIGRASGMDVEAIDRKAKADEAAAKAAAARKAAAAKAVQPQ